ncbi:hypothetical protein EV356DRAFT_52002 [Viridothelium virens]|uniref:Uncharacterized protein n=1 Tax=Viridothelium virens TaxID=1048519 RepID=A0A6A6HGX2_VIRVR|nr:hypothetical protein EV356DRAFT_52002 [Viridothelium virens]
MGLALAGEYQAGLNSAKNPLPYELNGESVTDAVWLTDVSGTVNGIQNGPLDGTMVQNTPLYTLSAFSTVIDPNQGRSSKDPFIVTQDLLNAMLGNIALSTVPAFHFSTGSTDDLTQTPVYNVYAVSFPRLLIPYFLVLALCLPLMGLGLSALPRNGVTASDGGFFRILCTTRGSRMLDGEAEKGCRGGAENVPDSLKRLELKFGHFGAEEDAEYSARNAGNDLMGFGTKEELR